MGLRRVSVFPWLYMYTNPVYMLLPLAGCIFNDGPACCHGHICVQTLCTSHCQAIYLMTDQSVALSVYVYKSSLLR